jgi:hypothetical protein
VTAAQRHVDAACCIFHRAARLIARLQLARVGQLMRDRVDEVDLVAVGIRRYEQLAIPRDQ